MALPLPNLDNRTYADLVAEMRALVPTYDPHSYWTDHNPSSPGVTLLELFAWLAEMLIYRINRVPDEHVRTFLKLLNGPKWQPGPDLAEDIRTSVMALRGQERTVTCADYEKLAQAASPDVARVQCIAQRNLDAGTEMARGTTQPGHISVIIVPSNTAVFLLDALYTDYTTEARTGSGTAFPLNSTPGTFLYIGALAPFDTIQFRFDVKGGKYTLQFAYFNGANWVPLTPADHQLNDGTANWGTDGSIQFKPPVDWVQTTVNNLIRYWLRVTTTTAPAPVATAWQILLPVMLQPTPELIQTVAEYLEPRRMLATRNHVVGPFSAPISAEILIARRVDVRVEDLKPRVMAALTGFLDPLTGGPDGNGWPFGRGIYVSELYGVLEAIPGVDYVPDINLSSECLPDAQRCVAADPLWHEDGELIGLALAAHHLPLAQLDPAQLVVASAFVAVQVGVQVQPPATLAAAVVRRQVKTAVKRFFHPLHGDLNGTVKHEINVDQIRSVVHEQVAVSLADISVTLRRDNKADRVTSIVFEQGELADVQVNVDLI